MRQCQSICLISLFFSLIAGNYYRRRVRGDCVRHHPVSEIPAFFRLRKKPRNFRALGLRRSDMSSLAAVIEGQSCPIGAPVSACRIHLPGNDRTRFRRLVRNSPETGSQSLGSFVHAMPYPLDQGSRTSNANDNASVVWSHPAVINRRSSRGHASQSERRTWEC
jgi:hypothetical protein